MYKKILVMLPSILVAFYLSIFPVKTFAASWSNFASNDKNVYDFVVSKANKNEIIYSNPDGMFFTENGGVNWQNITTNPATGICTNFLQSNQDTNEYWAGCMGLYHSTDKGHTFQRIDSSYFNNKQIQQVKQDIDGTLYVTVNSSTNYRSHDGLIWETFNGAGIYSKQFFPDPRSAGTIYLVSTLTNAKGLYRSQDYGENWIKLIDIPAVNLSTQILFLDDRMCASSITYGYGCSNDNGMTWHGFGIGEDNSGIPSMPNYIYDAYQNPDDKENVFIYVGDIYYRDKRLYSRKQGDTSWTLEYLPSPLSVMKISQGTVFGKGSAPGLWRNDGLATIPEEMRKHPVIIVPGLLGSWDDKGKLTLDPITGTYDTLVDSFKASGMEEGKWLFTFPYNWRKDNIETARLLKEKINEAKAASGERKVDIVAHSMGGLVARAYAQSDYYENDIDQIIFLGTPHLGSAKSYVPYETGDVKFGNSLIAGNYFNYIFEKEASKNSFSGPNKIYQYIRAMVPSVRQLLPITSYLDKSGFLLAYPEGYPTNTFLEELDAKKSIIKERKIRTTSIIGVKTSSTIFKYGILPSTRLPLWENGEPINFYSILFSPYVYRTSGDDTVTVESASAVGDKVVTIEVNHGELPTLAVREVENELIMDRKIVVEKRSTKKGILSFIHSPIDVLFVDPLGRRVGTDPVTKKEINEIPGAFYTNENDIEFVILPNTASGEYKITASGTSSGSYKIETHYVDEDKNTDIESDYTGQAEVGKIDTLNLGLDVENQKVVTGPEDNTPPIIDLSLSSYYLSRWDTLSINHTETDDISGVDKTYIYLDNQIVDKDEINLFDLALGKHYVKVASCDKANNCAEKEKSFEVYTNENLTIKDIAWAQGGMRNFGLGVSLMGKIELAGIFKTAGRKEKGVEFLNLAKKEIIDAYKKGKMEEKYYKMILEDINYLLGGGNESNSNN